MNKKIFMITFMLMLFLFVGTSSANEQEATFEIYTSSIEGNNTKWVLHETIKLIDDEKRDVAGTSIKLVEITSDNKGVWINFNNEDFPLNIREGAANNGWDSRIFEDLKIKLDSITEDTSDFNPNYKLSDETPVSVYIKPSVGDEKYLTVNGVNSFNPVEYGSDSGWTTTYEKEEVILYAERLEKHPVAFNMESNGNWESKEEENLIKFYLKSNAEYVFTIDYTKKGVWGGETDTTDTYMISISGLGESTTQTLSDDSTTMNDNSDDSKPIVEGDYRLNVGDSKNIITDEDGEWTLDTGYTINPNIANDKYVWTFDFSREGNYRPEFTSDSGEMGFVDFNIQPKEVTANVVQGTDNSSSAGKVVALLGLILIAIGIFIFLQKKKGSKFSMKKSDSSSSVSPVEKDFI